MLFGSLKVALYCDDPMQPAQTNNYDALIKIADTSVSYTALRSTKILIYCLGIISISTISISIISIISISIISMVVCTDLTIAGSSVGYHKDSCMQK